MATSRRNFLKTGTMCALFAGVPGIVASVAKGNPARVSQRPQGGQIQLTRSTFAPFVNTTFRVQAGPLSVVELTLVSAADLKAAAPNPSLTAGTESFSLLFVGSRLSSRLMDGTYNIDHGALGRFSLFMAPVGKPQQRRYEAIVIRM
jgi:hypothetical protein